MMSEKIYVLLYVVVRDGGSSAEIMGENWLAHNYGSKPLIVLACIFR